VTGVSQDTYRRTRPSVTVSPQNYTLTTGSGIEPGSPTNPLIHRTP